VDPYCSVKWNFTNISELFAPNLNSILCRWLVVLGRDMRLCIGSGWHRLWVYLLRFCVESTDYIKERNIINLLTCMVQLTVLTRSFKTT
jgi:hypothetical protein